MNNTDIQNYILNHRAFVLLGLVAEIPSHAYNINQRIEDRGMREWTNIGKSSIYNIITKLEDDGLVESYNEEVDNRIRKIYTITDYGSDILKNQVYKVLSEFIGKKDEDFYVAFSMLPILTKEQQIEAITKSLKKIKKNKKGLEKMLKENAQMPLNVRGLFFHPIKILETDIEFLEWVLEEIKEAKGQVGPKAYGK
ncbi:MAG: PadR family transcriptional regulator [Candidatus Hodarchaeota archaeon]